MMWLCVRVCLSCDLIGLLGINALADLACYDVGMSCYRLSILLLWLTAFLRKPTHFTIRTASRTYQLAAAVSDVVRVAVCAVLCCHIDVVIWYGKDAVTCVCVGLSCDVVVMRLLCVNHVILC